MITLDRQRWKVVKDILADALILEPAQRGSFIEEACQGDPELAAEVSGLLALDGEEADRLETPAIEELYGDHSSLIGSSVDRYKIISELGSGGMGAVYLCERDEGTFIQRVALKLIRRGLDNKEILTRFLNERQILASLRHENIAHLIDGGTTRTSEPYLVMEYVEGVPITEFVRSNGYGLKQRLRLFLHVCSAVSYAHQNLVIHRDLKPSNILVTSTGVPKLLDFGIAKIVGNSSSGLVTATQRFIFTPEYASPEQVCGENLTTATDVYSLGILLYELLTDRRPYSTEAANITQIVKIICESEPAPPSRLKTATGRKPQPSKPFPEFVGELKGDLDSIILKALRKEPEKRYRSVGALSTDITNYLDGLPVSARSGTRRYRAGKFIRRNSIPVAAGAVVLLATLGGVATTLYQASVARTERARAERRFNDVRHLANSFVFEINDEIDRSPIQARALVVQRAIEYLDDLKVESGGDDSLVAELAAAYEKIGDVQSELFRPNLGNAGGALESHQKALDLRTQLLNRDRQDITRNLDLAKSYLKVGGLLTVTGDVTAAADHYRHAAEVCEEVSRLHPNDDSVRKVQASAYTLLGQVTLRMGSLAESLAQYHKASAMYQGIAQADPSTDNWRRVSVVHNYAGWLKVLMGDAAGASADLERSLEIEREILATDPQNNRYQENVGVAQLWVGIGDREAGRLAESLGHINRAIRIQEEMLQADPQNFGERNAMADCLLELGLSLDRMSRFGEAVQELKKAEGLYASVYEKDKNDLSVLVQVQMARRLKADALLKKGETTEARAEYEKSFEVMDELTRRDAHNLDWKFELALCDAGKGKAELALRDPQASADLERSSSLIHELIAISPTNMRYMQSLAEVERALASDHAAVDKQFRIEHRAARRAANRVVT